MRQPDSEHRPRSPKLTTRKLGEILWGSLFEAFVATILVFVLGGVALGLIGGLLNEMIPSPPPLANQSPLIERPGETATVNDPWLFVPRENRFAIVFAMLYLWIAGLQLTKYSRGAKQRRTAAFLRQTSKRVSEQWFGVIVGNAFGAFFVAIALFWAQQFSFAKWLVHWFLGLFHPVIHGTVSIFLNANHIATIQGLIAWYDDNQFKFTFWFLYTSTILDDMGVPNFKTLCRKLWRQSRSTPGKERLQVSREPPS